MNNQANKSNKMKTITIALFIAATTFGAPYAKFDLPVKQGDTTRQLVSNPRIAGVARPDDKALAALGYLSTSYAKPDAGERATRRYIADAGELTATAEVEAIPLEEIQAAKDAADAEVVRLTKRPKRSQINSAIVATDGAQTVPQLRAAVIELMVLLENVLEFQKVDIDEDE